MAGHSRKRARKQKMFLVIAVIILVVIIGGITAMTTVMKKYSPSKERTDYTTFYGLSNENDVFVCFDNQVLENTGIVYEGEVYLPYDIVHGVLNKRFYWDETEEILRYTLPEGLVNVVGETTEYTIGKDSYSASYQIVVEQGDETYISRSFVEQYTHIHSEVYENPNRIVISDQWEDVEYTSVKQETEIRQLGGVKSPILTEVSKGDLVMVLEELDNWSQVCTEDGFVGYIKKKALGGTQTKLYEDSFVEQEYTHIFRNNRINMAWHQVTNTAANRSIASVLDTTTGVNVISPTWFQLSDSEGGIVSFASSDYVATCHQRGIEVWGLVSNLENENVDVTRVLSVTSSRDRLVNNLIAQAVQYSLDGINVDFENLEGAAGAGYQQFIRELSLKCRGNGIVLSVDNYSPAPYNQFYGMDEQAVFADYIILMAYDEHYNGSEEGSVASLGFVNQGVNDSLQMVPAEQLILGIPFYTRLWKLTASEGGEESNSVVTSEALGMSEVESRVAANGATYSWLEDCGQYYAQYDNEGSTYKVWLEDQNSIEKKLEVMKTNGLAGAAFWKLGYEKNTIWNAIAKYMNE